MGHYFLDTQYAKRPREWVNMPGQESPGSPRGCVRHIHSLNNKSYVSVVVYHVNIVVNGLLKKFWPLVLGCVLRTAGSLIIWNPRTLLELLNYYLTLAWI